MNNEVKKIVRRIIKLREGDVIPEGAIYLHSSEEKVTDGFERVTEEGLFTIREYRRQKFKMVAVHFYEVSDETHS